jgi:hypothetical protein
VITLLCFVDMFVPLAKEEANFLANNLAQEIATGKAQRR